jgi:hypothetical protein
VTGWLSSRPDEVACGEASVRIIATDFAFSETLVITINEGRPVSVMPRYTDTSFCVACNEAIVDLSRV